MTSIKNVFVLNETNVGFGDMPIVNINAPPTDEEKWHWYRHQSSWGRDMIKDGQSPYWIVAGNMLLSPISTKAYRVLDQLLYKKRMSGFSPSHMPTVDEYNDFVNASAPEGTTYNQLGNS